jgi:hypothetical protein
MVYPRREYEVTVREGLRTENAMPLVLDLKNEVRLRE